MNRPYSLDFGRGQADSFGGRDVADIDVPGNHRGDRQRRALQFDQFDFESFALIEAQVFGQPIDRIGQGRHRRGAEADTQLERFLGFGIRRSCLVRQLGQYKKRQ